MDLEDLAPNLRPDADRSTKRGKAPANKDRIERAKMAGGQRGANSIWQ